MVNLVAKQLIEEKQTLRLCTQHDEKIRLLCFTDKSAICDDCALFGEHKGHDIKPMKTIQSQLDTKKKSLETALERFDRHYRDIDTILDETRASLVKAVKDQFADFEKILKRKESELLYEVNCFFDTQKTQTSDILGVNSGVRSNLTKKLLDYRDPFKYQRLFDLIEEDLTFITSKFGGDSLRKHVQNLSQKFNKITGSFCGSLASQTLLVSQIDLPLKELSDASATLFKVHKQEAHSTTKSTIPNSFKAKTLLGFGKQDGCLGISVQDKDPEDFALDADDFKEMKKVRILINKYTFSDQDINALYYVWSNVEDVSCLELICDPKGVSDNALLNIFPVIFWRTKELKHIKIHLNNCKVGDESIAFFMEKVLPKLSNLQSLDLSLCNTDITDKSISMLGRGNEAVIKPLEAFRLNLQGTKVTDEGLVHIFVPMPGIKTLYLNLTETATGNKTLEALSKNSLAHAQGLESFAVHLSTTKVTDQGAVKLFVNMQSIKEFVLDLSNTKITNKAVKSLGVNGIARMKSLTLFELRLDNTGITDNSVSGIWSPMEGVKKFVLYLDSTEITDKSIGAFVKNTLDSMKGLETLEVYISGTEVSDKSAIQLFSSVPSVRELIVDLNDTKITNKTLEVLGKDTLPRMEALESFELVLYDTGVTDEGVVQIFVPMESVKRYVLHLDSTEITDESLEAFAKNTLPKMKAMEEFEIHLFDTRVTDAGVRLMLGGMEGLSRLILDLDSTDVTDEIGEEFIRDLLPNMKSLREFEIDLSNTQVSEKVQEEINLVKEKLVKKRMSGG